jgi:hypothetical protein
MTDTSAPETTEDTMPCKACGEPIKKVARVCPHCNSYQNWWGAIGISDKILALLVALFSVLGVVVPIIVAAFTPKNSSLLFSYLGADADSISVLATNDGIRPGAVRYPVSLGISRPESQSEATSISLKVREKGGNAALIVEPGRSVAIDLYERRQVNQNPELFSQFENPEFLSQFVCKLQINTTDFRAASTVSSLDVYCKEFIDFVKRISAENHEDR